MIRGIATTILIFVSLQHVSATTYFVSTTGKDSNNGKALDQSWATLQKAADVMLAGDTCFVADGAYSQDIKINRSGSESGDLTFKSINKWGAKITSENYIFNIGESAEGVGYITIDGFELTATGTYGVGVHSKDGAHHITVRNCWVHDCGESGISLQDGDYRVIENNVCNNNSALMKYCGSGISVFGSAMFDEKPGFHTIIRNNICFRNMNDPQLTLNTDGNGIIVDDLRNTQTGNHFAGKNINYTGNETLVENNLCYENGGAGIQLYVSNNITVRNNTCYNNQLRRSKETWRGNISASCCANVLFVNNISVVSTNLRADGGSSDWSYFSSNSAFGAFGLTGDSYAKNYTFFNNIAYNLDEPKSDAITAQGIVIALKGVNNNKIATDPLLVNAGKLITSDFRLKPGSPAIDAGTSEFRNAETDLDNKSRIINGTIDIGAYEYDKSVSAIRLTSPELDRLNYSYTGNSLRINNLSCAKCTASVFSLEGKLMTKKILSLENEIKVSLRKGAVYIVSVDGNETNIKSKLYIN